MHHYIEHIEKDNSTTWVTYETNKKYYKGNINLGMKKVNQGEKEKYQFYTTNNLNYNYTEEYNHYLWVELATGAYEAEENGTKKTVSSKVKNIYDMAGNMWEWTTEVGNHSTSDTMVAQNEVDNAKYAVLRGGSFLHNGGVQTVAYRNGDSGSGGSITYVGFRVVLYLR